MRLRPVLMSASRFSQCAIHFRGVRHKLKLGVCKPRISALKWGAGGWAGGLYRKLKDKRVGSNHLKLKMFSKKTRELIKTHSVSKKSRTGNSPSSLNSPSVSRTASLDLSSCQSTWLTFHSRAHVLACFSTLLKIDECYQCFQTQMLNSSWWNILKIRKGRTKLPQCDMAQQWARTSGFALLWIFFSWFQDLIYFRFSGMY